MSNDIASLRGANTKENSSGVNLGSLIPTTMIATTSNYSLISGTAGHWNLPTDGTHPTPNNTGVSVALNGGPYVFIYTLSDGTNPISATLTITCISGRSLAAWNWNMGRNTVAAESFSAACYTVSTATELGAIGSMDASGATILLAKGASPFAVVIINFFPPNSCLIQSEDITVPGSLSRLTINPTSSKIRFDSINFINTFSGLGNSNLLSINPGVSDVRFSNLSIGAPNGAIAIDFPPSIINGDSIYFNKIILQRYLGMGIRSVSNFILNNFTIKNWAVDALFLGGPNESILQDIHFENGVLCDGNWNGSGNHPDTMQIQTTPSTGTITFTGYFRVIDIRAYGGSGGISFNGMPFTGDYHVKPIFRGQIQIFGCVQSSLTSYGVGQIANADYSASILTEQWGCCSVRQLTGVTGSISGGKGSGAQGFNTWNDAGTAPIPSTNQIYPGQYNFTYDYPSGCNYNIMNSYYDGLADNFPASMNVSSSYFKGRSASSVDPVGLSPSQINDNSAYFDDPNRVVDWSTLTPTQIDATYADMYATKAGGTLDNGDGTVIGRWCVRRAGATAKVNQIGRSSLSIFVDYSVSDAIVSVSIDSIIGVDVICDLARNGTIFSYVVIAAGTLTKSIGAGFSAVPGDIISALNDCGLANQAVTIPDFPAMNVPGGTRLGKTSLGLTGVSDGTQVWVGFDLTPGSVTGTQVIICESTGSRFIVVLSGSALQVVIRNASNQTIVSAVATNFFTVGTRVQGLLSVDLTQSSFSAGFKLFKNGIQVTAFSVSNFTPANGNISLTTGNFGVFGTNLNNGTPGNTYSGVSSLTMLGIGSVDWSNADVRAKVNPTNVSSLSPVILIEGNASTAELGTANLGTGGAFVKNGSGTFTAA